MKIRKKEEENFTKEKLDMSLSNMNNRLSIIEETPYEQSSNKLVGWILKGMI